jgi:hypothetical protein
MKFYYRYICGLKEPESITEEIDPALLGSLLHDVMKNLYRDFKGRSVTARDIELIMSDNRKIQEQIKITIKELFGRENDAALAGNELIVNQVLMVYIDRILEADKAYAPFTILDLETPVRFEVTSGKRLKLLAGGNIDRVDKKDGITRIVDYKTGTIADSIDSVSDLFADDRKKDPDGWLQTLLYCEGYIISAKPGEKVRPSVYKIKKASAAEKGDVLRIRAAKNEEIEVNDYASVRDEFISGLIETVNKIFSINEPFRMTADQWIKCSYCPYHNLCLR